MQKARQSTGRKFLKQLTGTTLAVAATPLALFANRAKKKAIPSAISKKISINDQINVAATGMGIMAIIIQKLL